MTMVYQDYMFLERFVDYYAAQIGRDNIYVISHGNDPRHRDIADGCNILSFPRDPQINAFDRRRWTALSSFASGLSQFYRWVITSDVDEFVLLDPAVGDSLPAYLEAKWPGLEDAPASICPFAIEPIHRPEDEPLPIEADAPILSRRRIYRPNANYCKPCITRGAVRFTPGGHANTLGKRYLSDDLYLLHLRFFDRDYVTRRLNLRADQIRNLDWITDEQKASHGWTHSLDEYLDAARWPIEDGDLRHPAMRKQMVTRQQQRPGTQIWGWGRTAGQSLYRLPDRFADLV
ncbi:glycosyltransferase family 2 protein [Paracoccus sp. p4-l81]